MIVAVQSFSLELPGCRSLKEKRMVVRSLKDRIRQRFNVSVAETGAQDRWGSAELTVALVSHDRGQADQLLDRLDAFVEQDGRVVLGPVRRELF